MPSKELIYLVFIQNLMARIYPTAILIVVAFLFLLFLTPFQAFIPMNTSNLRNHIDYESLAKYWAPIVMQDTSSDNYRADYITCYTYDGDYAATNNWDNLDNYPLKAYLYYWVVETETNYFIGYAVFHPRDWSSSLPWIDEHENDLEGVLICVQKDGGYGKFLVMETIAHINFYSYKDYDSYPSSNVTDGNEDIDGDVEFLTVSAGDSLNQSGVWCGEHPYIYVEGEGHAIYGDKRWENSGFPDGDGIVYYPTGIAEEPDSGNDNFCGYALIPIDDLWNRRYDSEIFSSYGTFDKDNGAGEAHAPWAWDDSDDGECYPPDFFDDPAYLVDYYHNGLGNFSHVYVGKSWNYVAETFHNCRSDYDRTIWWKVGSNSFRIHFQNISVASSDYVQILSKNGTVLWEFSGSDASDFYTPYFNGSIFGVRIVTSSDTSWGYSIDFVEEGEVAEVNIGEFFAYYIFTAIVCALSRKL